MFSYSRPKHGPACIATYPYNGIRMKSGNNFFGSLHTFQNFGRQGDILQHIGTRNTSYLQPFYFIAGSRHLLHLILPLAPTNNICVPGLISSNARAMAMAGNMCPPCTTPADYYVKLLRQCFLLLLVFLLFPILLLLPC